jgi:hypothetical protein
LRLPVVVTLDTVLKSQAASIRKMLGYGAQLVGSPLVCTVARLGPAQNHEAALPYECWRTDAVSHAAYLGAIYKENRHE